MDLGEVQERLGIEFNDTDLLLEALTHSSCLTEPQQGYHRSNEALAWIGDALIGWVQSEAIFNGWLHSSEAIKNPDLSTGELTERRKLYVEKKYLAEHAEELGLDRALIMPEHRVKEGGRQNLKNLHTVFEAIVGAVYRDKGYTFAKDFILSF